MKKWIARVAPITTVVALVLMVSAPMALATENPEWRAGNPSCADLGLKSLHKFDDSPTDGEHSEDGFTVIVDSPSVDWTSDVPLDAVIMKGGDNANIYHYDEATSGNDLVTPTNPNNNEPYDLSHVEGCYDETEADDVTVDVSLGTCVDDTEGSHTPVTVTISGDGGATVTILDENDAVVQTFTASGSVDLDPGDYTYTVVADEGSEPTEGSDDGGELEVGDCSIEVLPSGSVNVEQGACDPTNGTDVDVSVAPDNAATLTITDADDNVVGTFTSNGSTSLDPGHYTWAAVAAEGFTLNGATSGSLNVKSCDEGEDDKETKVLGVRLSKTGDPITQMFLVALGMLMLGALAVRISNRSSVAARD
jgi:hypothetical protein